MESLSIKEQEQKYLHSYSKSLELWPCDYSAYYVATSHGKTHIVESGSKSALPLILLHGASMSSTMWYPNVKEWSKKYRVFCIDILGDKNKSDQDMEFADRASYAKWMKEVFDELNIKKADIVGLSYGALNTVNFLQYYPEKVRKAVIMSPAATYVPLDSIFYSYVVGMINNRVGVEKFLEWVFNNRYKVHPFMLEQLVAGMMWQDKTKGTSPKETGFPYVFTDEELAAIHTPILLLFGEEEVLYNVKEAYTRAIGSSPNITVEMIQNAGHLMSMEKPTYINARILDFL